MDQQSFDALYAATAGPLWAYLVRFSGRPDIADDVLQETYCRYLSSVRQNMAIIDARPYLFRIARNLLNDRWRRGDDRAHEEGPEARAEANLEAILDIRAMMEQLKPRDRELLWMAYVEGMTHHEIAVTTGLSAVGIRAMLFRARRRAMALMEKRSLDELSKKK